jgi:hypothetical protein
LPAHASHCIIGGGEKAIQRLRRDDMVSGWLDRIKLKLRRALGKNVILCDSCKWDWRSACHNRARPNATSCPDYEKRGS